MKQKHKAITALQGKLQVAENAGDDNAARIASLQVIITASLEMQRPSTWFPQSLSGQHKMYNPVFIKGHVYLSERRVLCAGGFRGPAVAAAGMAA